MSNFTGDDQSDAVLSDVEDEEYSPVKFVDSGQSDVVSAVKFRELMAEFDREKQARVIAENSRSELEISFTRLKSLTHEAIKKRDEAVRGTEKVESELVEVTRRLEEVIRVKDEVTGQLEEAMKWKDEVTGRLEEVVRGKDVGRTEIETSAAMLVAGIEKISGKVSHIKNFNVGGLPRSEKYTGLPSVVYGVIKRTIEIVEEVVGQIEVARAEKDEVTRRLEGARTEIEAAATMLVSGIEKISGKVSHIKNFTSGGLPRSEKYTGLPSVAYGVIKRANEIVEEVVGQIEVANKSRDEAREQMEQRNYEIAIEVSELEASVGRLKVEVDEKSTRNEELEKCVVEKDERIKEIESETGDLREMVDDCDGRVRELESEITAQRPLLVEQLSFVSKIYDQLCSAIRIVDASNGGQSDFVECLFVLQDTGLENVRATLAGLESIFELSKVVSAKTKDVVEEKSRAVKSLNETVARLFREKEHVGVLLRSALSKRLTSNQTSKANAVFQVAENGLREAGIEFKFGAFLEDENLAKPLNKDGAQETKDDEIYELAGALENIIKEAQLQIIELQHSVEELREESSLLKDHLETQSKELSHRKHRIEELELKERQATEDIQELRLDIAAAEEEITRWKGAAEQEAAAGSSIEQEYLAQISSLKQEVEEAKQTMLESVKKLKFKEETAAAAMAARVAAEESLRLADIRATRLRDRLEELSRQLEKFESKGDDKSRTRPRYVCWPWEWLGGVNFVGYQQQTEPPEQQNPNETELSEPLL